MTAFLRSFPARAVLALLAVVLAAGAAPLPSRSAGSGADADHERAREARRRGDYVPLAEILADAERRYPGRVIEVELDDDQYEIEILQADGRVVELEYDARTGRLEDVDYDDD
ncbi:PepSY domain-containing protein [Coralloluteibacterium thermophilus]|uniref:PepSY domain-containing protein n=1 Tax=Coralloluteibacterium thermophilum TaxID=2707049 RepID=A0ABV9NKW5_9GAMM